MNKLYFTKVVEYIYTGSRERGSFQSALNTIIPFFLHIYFDQPELTVGSVCDHCLISVATRRGLSQFHNPSRHLRTATPNQAWAQRYLLQIRGQWAEIKQLEVSNQLPSLSRGGQQPRQNTYLKHHPGNDSQTMVLVVVVVKIIILIKRCSLTKVKLLRCTNIL